jgi:uncharacterized protein YkwD
MRAFCLLLVALLGCGSSPRTRGAREPEEEVSKKTIVERMPDGSLRKTTVTTTRRRAEPPASPPRPADPFPADPLVKYNVERVNAYRAAKGLPALLYDAKISAFARAGSEQLADDHRPHAHFQAKSDGAPGFGNRSAENQGDPSGVSVMDPDPVKSGKKQIDTMLRLMMDEGPGGGHYENIVSTHFRRVGIGLVYVQGRLYLTNDFSD